MVAEAVGFARKRLDLIVDAFLFAVEGLPFPHERASGQILWVKPTYIATHTVLSNPVYAGAYAYGKSRSERYVDATGRVRKRVRLLPRDQWAVLIRGHHPGFIDWATFEMNQARLASNTHPGPHQAGGAVREGSALLQGLATCGRCGRHLRVYYEGKNSTPGYYCANSQAFNGRGTCAVRRLNATTGDSDCSPRPSGLAQ